MSFNLIGLATRIKTSRKSRGWTLDQVSEKTGLGKGLLSKVENFRVTPSLPTIAKISKALNLTLVQLFEGLDETSSVKVIRAEDKKEVQRNLKDPTVRHFDLAHDRSTRTMDPFELIIAAGGGSTSQLSHEGEEFLTVISGEVILTIEDDDFALEKGDSIYFNAETPHSIQNKTDTEAKLMSVATA